MSARGFTLLELLLALTLSALLGVAVLVALDQGRRAESQATADADARQVGRVALEWIARDLQSLVETASAFNPGLTGSDAELESQAVDTLFCTTTAHLPAWRELDETPDAAQANPMATLFGAAPPPPTLESDCVQVEYYLGSAADEPPGLLRRVRVLPTIETTDEADGFTTLSIAQEVLGLDLKYFDGSDWQDEWDSATSNTYPDAIQVILTVAVESGPTPRTRQFTRTVVLSTEPFIASDPQAQPAQGGVR